MSKYICIIQCFYTVFEIKKVFISFAIWRSKSSETLEDIIGFLYKINSIANT